VKFVAGGALAAALFVSIHFMVPGPNAASLKHDHAKQWSYVKVPHRAANVLERRLGEVASLVAGRPVQVRREDFSDGEIVEPGGVVQFNGAKPADVLRHAGGSPCRARTRRGELCGRSCVGSHVYLVGYPGMPLAYRSGECRPGGRLDLSSGPNWP
jgi:hypothetical protein